LDGTIQIWDAASPAEAARWIQHDQEVERRQAAWQAPARDASGFIQDWLVLLLPEPKVGEIGARGLEIEHLPREASLQPRAGERERLGGQEIAWQAVHEKEPILDFNRLAGKQCDDGVAYAVCYVISEAERKDLLVQVGSDDGARMYLNSQEIYKYTGMRAMPALDPSAPVTFRKGTNVLVLKVVNENGAWLGCVRIVDREGNPVQGLQVRLTPD
jgi:hypothetical protein